MSSYFDKFDREVRGLRVEMPDDGEFVKALGEMEQTMYRDVTAISGDREFPETFREKMLNAFALESVMPGTLPVLKPAARAVEMVALLGASLVSRTLHEYHHQLTRERIGTRFGYLSDSPTQNLLLRDSYDEEREEIELRAQMKEIKCGVGGPK